MQNAKNYFQIIIKLKIKVKTRPQNFVSLKLRYGAGANRGRDIDWGAAPTTCPIFCEHYAFSDYLIHLYLIFIG